MVSNVNIGCEGKEALVVNPIDDYFDPSGLPGCVVINAK